MDTNIHETFLKLVRLGIGHTDSSDNTDLSWLSGGEWSLLKNLAATQGLSAVVLDGLNALNTKGTNLPDSMPKMVRLEWIGEVLQEENLVAAQAQAARDMAQLFAKNYIRTYVLKGEVIAECYPKPNHRRSVDMDCFLLPEKGESDAWSLCNDLINAQGHKVEKDFYKNSTFHLPNLVVENHKYLVPFRGNKKLRNLEVVLQSLIKEDKGEDRIEDTYLFRPPVLVTALFMIEHAYSHFLHEGLTWRHVLDWVMFSKRHKSETDWRTLDAFIDEFGFHKFYNSYCRMGQLLMGDISEDELTKAEMRMLADVWAPLDVHPEGVTGWKGKLALAGNTWRARWKYHYFTETNWINALWIQTKGFLFEKNPQL